MKKKFSLFFFIIFLLIILALIFKPNIYRLFPQKHIGKNIRTELQNLGEISIEFLDVPVSSIIIYNNKIIGKGYNTVIKDTLAGGHAEINAISDAIKNAGMKEFFALDRDSLILISTFEPCPMCKGAFQIYKIKNVYFGKSKTAVHWIENYIGELLYEFNKRKFIDDGLQDSLFNLHPLRKE